MTAEINDRAQECPAERDQRFASLMEAEVLAGYRRATYLGIPLVMGFGILDLLSLDGHEFALFIGLRVGLSFVLFALLRVAHLGERWILPAVVVGTYLAGTGILLLIGASAVLYKQRTSGMVDAA